MPDTISLRAYLARLEEQLRANATDEVVQHCRHILKHYPKHVDTYRLLGRALLFNARWDEAAAVLRRVLAVVPDDRVAHIGMAEVYSERNQGNEAIWHLERAYEHDPNDEQLIAALRDLYKRFHGVEYDKIQLTAGAVARQYARNSLYEQAADTLRTTLETHRDRVDLRLLLAQMLWGAEKPVEAAEVALDVLDLLPDCVAANRIMTRLWLQESRPTDAQRYINRIEAVDPYAALELATGTKAADSAFNVPELDYRRYAETVIAADQPDWLQDIGDDVPPELAEPTGKPSAPATGLLASMPDERPAPTLPDDWLTETDLEQLKPTTNLPSRRDEVSDIDLRFDDTLDDVEPPEATTSVAARDLRRETSSLASIYSAHEDAEVPDWLADEDAPNLSDWPEGAEQAENAEDPLAWLMESGEFDIEGGGDSAPTVEAPAVSEPQEDEDPLAWLQDAEVELHDDAAPTAEAPSVESQPVEQDDDDDDPLGWLRESGIEIEDDDAPADEQPAATGEAEDPLAWLRESGIEIDESEPEPALEDPFETADEIPFQDPASDPLGWMSAYSDDILLSDETDEPTTEPPTYTAPPPADNIVESNPDEAPSSGSASTLSSHDDAADEDDFDWLQDENLLDDVTPPRKDVTSEWNAARATADEDSISTGLLRRLGSTVESEEMNILENNGAAPAAANDEFDWLMDAGGSAQEPAPQDAEMADRREAMSDKDHNLNPDWRDEDSNATGDNTPDWLNDFAADENAPAQPSEEIPEWLAALGPDYVQPESAGEEPHHTPEQSSADEGEAFAWSSQVDEDEAPAASASEATDIPSWLSAEEPATSDLPDTSSPDWLSDFQSEADVEAATEATSDTPEEADIPSWLSELQPPEASGAPVASLHDDEDEPDESFGWIDQMIEKEEAGESLLESEPVASAPDDEEADNAPAWLADFQTESEAADEAPSIEQPVASIPDDDMDNAPSWLSELQNENVVADEAPLVEQPIASTSDEEEADNAPAWLSDLQDVDEDEGVAEATDDEAAVGLEMPEWLSDLTEPEESADEVEEVNDEVLDVETFDWADELEDADEPAVTSPAASIEESEAEEAPATPPAPPEELPEGEAASEAFSWSSEFDTETAGEPFEDATPDWLKEFQPDDAPVSEATDDGTVVTVQPGEQPEWLSETLAAQEDAEAAEPEPAISALDEFDFEMEAPEELLAFESESQPPQNAPDWLNAMVPGVDLDYAPESDEVGEPEPAAPVSERRAEREFEWLVDIVEEETQPAPEPAAAHEPAPVQEAEAPRFAFSKLPAWLRGKEAPAGDSSSD